MGDELLIAGSAILIILIAAGLILLNLRAFSFRKAIQGQNISITITAKRNLDKLTVIAIVDGEEVKFERRRVRKGQSVDFVFPSEGKKARIIADLESGGVQEAEA